MVRIKDLMAKGLLAENDELVWKQKTLGVEHIAIITKYGEIRTSDGQLHRTPSGAAKWLNGGKSVDGWLTWKTKKHLDTLDALRKQL
ncbi:Restriction enzyme adenine methylase associated [actinobacterium SCGC AAA044-D11]|jgi:hypothetical protein